MGLIDNINKLFDHRIRLGIIDFNGLKELLKVTDGNLASHTKTLEKAEYVKIEKSFIGKKPNTRYTITPLGRQAFQKHINALELIIKQHE